MIASSMILPQPCPRRISATVDYRPALITKTHLEQVVLERCRQDEYKGHLLQLRKKKHEQRVAKTRILKKLVKNKSPTNEFYQQQLALDNAP